MYLGMVVIDDLLNAALLVTNSSDMPINADSAPSYRIYGPSGILTNGSGTLSFAHTGSLTGATNVTPIEITSAAHKLTTGTRVTITGVGGNTGANGTFTATSTGTNTFTLGGSVGNGAYTSGGTWNATGLYSFQVTPSTAGGYEAGDNYTVVINALISAAVVGKTYSFGVA